MTNTALRHRGYLKNTGHEIDGRWLATWTPVIRPSTPNKQQTAVSSPSSRRIVLLGKTGVGKSAAGNTILGKKVFRSTLRMNAVTCNCSAAHATVSGRSVSVVDTPGFIDTQMKHDELRIEMARSIYLSSPGPHAFLIVFRVDDRFTEQELQIPQMISKLFGEEMLKYAIILFTHGDRLEGKSIKTFIEENCRLRDIVDQCGGGYQVFNNRDENNREQVNELLQKIDTMIEQNGGGYYSNEIYEDAQRFHLREEKSCEFTSFYTKNQHYFAAATTVATTEFAVILEIVADFEFFFMRSQKKEKVT